MESRRSAEHDTITVVTGANNGIGFETAKALAERGHTVIMACRDLSKAAAAKADNEELAATLWSHAEKLTNTTFTILPSEDYTLSSASAAARKINTNSEIKQSWMR